MANGPVQLCAQVAITRLNEPKKPPWRSQLIRRRGGAPRKEVFEYFFRVHSPEKESDLPPLPGATGLQPAYRPKTRRQGANPNATTPKENCITMVTFCSMTIFLLISI